MNLSHRSLANEDECVLSNIYIYIYITIFIVYTFHSMFHYSYGEKEQ